MRRPSSGSNVCAKVSPPRLPKTLERPKLYRALDQVARAPITWIHAPAGFGKTTLTASYLKARKLKALWYQIDEGDQEPATLFHYLGLLAKTAVPRDRKPLPHLTPEHFPSLMVFTRRFFEQLYSRIKTKGVLVLDNYQQLSADAETHHLVATGTEMLPPHIRLFVLSRTSAPPAFAKLLANQTMTVFDPHHFLLTPRETRAVCQMHIPGLTGAPLTDKANRIHQRTQGWMAGTMLLLQAETDSHQGNESELPQSKVMFEYMAKEVFQAYPPDLQRTLLKTAFLPSITPQMAGTMAGSRRGISFLQRLYRARYFVERHESPSLFYRYHPLFRDFLQTQVREHLTQTELQDLIRKTARQLEAAMQFEEAIKLLNEWENYETSIGLILSQAPNLVSQGRLQMLQGWIEAIPVDLREQYPWLSYWLGVCRFPYSPKEAQAKYTYAFEGFEKHNDHQGSLLARSGIMSAIINEWNDLSQLDQWLDPFADLYQQQKFQECPGAVKAVVAASIYQASMWRRPDRQEAERYLALSLKHIYEISDPFQRFLIGFNLVTYLCWKGDYQTAKDLVDNLDAHDSSRQHPAIIRSLFLTMKALLSWYRGDEASFDKASVDYQPFLEDLSIVGIQKAAMLAGLIYRDLQKGAIPRAHQHLATYQTHVTEGIAGMTEMHYIFMATWLATVEGKIVLAKRQGEKGLIEAKAMGVPVPELEMGLALSEICLEEENLNEARSYLVEYQETIHKLRFPMFLMKWWFLKVRLDWKEENRLDAIKALEKGLAIGRKFDCTTFPFWRADVMAELCVQALQHNIEVEFVQYLIRKRQLVPKAPPLTIPHWPWAIKISTFGRLAIEVDGELLQPSRKAPRKPLQLLKALIALGGKDIPETRLTDLLWPDAEGDMAHQTFATTLHRLRKVLKYEEAVLLQNKVVSLNPRYCWVDLWAWEAWLRELQHPSTSQNLADTLDQALGLYHGPFLPDEPDELWAERTRRRVEAQYQQLGERQAELMSFDPRAMAHRGAPQIDLISLESQTLP